MFVFMYVCRYVVCAHKLNTQTRNIHNNAITNMQTFKLIK